ncbi:hypothetical protein ACIXOC_04750 [Bacteroides fragilis]
MSQKRIILSDSSLNRYGYRVLTAGLLLEAFIDNPVMLYGHFRDEGSPLWCDYKAIGYWDDIKIEDDVLSAIPVFDKVDDLSKTIAAKYEAGTLRAASIGIRILATSSEKNICFRDKHAKLLPKQKSWRLPSWISRPTPMPCAYTTVPPPFYWQRVWTRILCQH